MNQKQTKPSNYDSYKILTPERQLLFGLFTRFKITLIDYFNFMPRKYFVNLIKNQILKSTSISFLIEYCRVELMKMYYGSDEYFLIQKNADINDGISFDQQIQKLILCSLYHILELLEFDIQKLITLINLPVNNEYLLQIICKIQQNKLDKRKSELYYHKFDEVLQFLNVKQQSVLQNYNNFLQESLNSIIKQTLFNFATKDFIHYYQNLESIFSNQKKIHKIFAIITKIHKSKGEFQLIIVANQFIGNIVKAQNQIVCLRYTLYSMIWYLLLHKYSLNHELTKQYKNVKLFYLRRLIFQSFYRWSFNQSQVFFIYLSEVKLILSEFKQQIQQIILDSCFCLYSLFEARQINKHSIIIRNLCVKQILILLSNKSLINHMFYLKRNWNNPQIQEYLFNKFTKSKYLESTKIENLILQIFDILDKVCQYYKIQKVYLCLLSLKDYLLVSSPHIISKISEQLFNLLQKSLIFVKKFECRMENKYKNNELINEIFKLITHHLMYCYCSLDQKFNTISIAKQIEELGRQNINLQAPVKYCQKLKQYIKLKKHYFTLIQLYCVQNMEHIMNLKVQSDDKRRVQSQFNFKKWILNLCEKYKFSDSMLHFFNLLIFLQQQPSIFNITVSLLYFQITNKDTNDLQLLETQIFYVFNEFIFTKKIDKFVVKGFLIAPCVVKIWARDKIRDNPFKKLMLIYDKLDKYKMAIAYKNIMYFPGAIYYLQKQLNECKIITTQRLYLLYKLQQKMCGKDKMIQFQQIKKYLNFAQDENISYKLTTQENYLKQIMKNFIKEIYLLSKGNKSRTYQRIYEFVSKSLIMQLQNYKTQYHQRQFYVYLKIASHLDYIVQICSMKLKSLKIYEQLTKGLIQKDKKTIKNEIKPIQKLIEEQIIIIRDLKMENLDKIFILQFFLECSLQIYQLTGYDYKKSTQYFLIDLCFKQKCYQKVHKLLKRLENDENYQYYLLRLKYEQKEYLQLMIQYDELDLGGNRKIFQLYYYYLSSKIEFVMSNLGLQKIINAMAKYFDKSKSSLDQRQFQYLNRILQIIYFKYPADQQKIHKLLGLIQNILIFCNDKQYLSAYKMLLKNYMKFIFDKMIDRIFFDEYSNFLVNLKLQSLIFHVQFIISRISLINYKNRIIESILIKIAKKQPTKHIWWVMSLVHYRDFIMITQNKKNSFPDLKSIFDDLDQKKQQIGKKIFLEIKSQIEGEQVLQFIQFLYYQFGVKEYLTKKEYLKPKLKIKKGFYLPFTKKYLVKRSLPCIDEMSKTKCQTMIFVLQCEQEIKNDSGKIQIIKKKLKILLKIECKINNQGYEKCVANLLKNIVPENLKITYQIFQLSKYMVMVEMVQNCDTLKQIITNLNFNDPINANIHKKIVETKDKKRIDQEYFLTNLPKIKPVLPQLFYFDKSIQQWWSFRNNFIITTAIWSVITYIFGLGDRHLANILFNKENGNVIHIDYEYFMDSGKNLPCPQYAPFRLTKNIEYSLGNLRGYGKFFCQFLKYFQYLKDCFPIIINGIDLFRNPDSKFNFYENIKNRLNIDSFNLKSFAIELIQESTNPHTLKRMYRGWCALE